MKDKTFTIRLGDLADADLLAELGARTFSATFGPENTPDDMDAYLAKAFFPERIQEELVSGRGIYFIAFLDETAVGYLKLRVEKTPAAPVGPKPIELERIYVLAQHKGGGIGSLMKDRALTKAKAQGYQTIWLGVWKENQDAIKVYTRWGFEIVGEQTFTLGQDIQFDWIMARPVNEDLT